jgi:hypothetical protein
MQPITGAIQIQFKLLMSTTNFELNSFEQMLTNDLQQAVGGSQVLHSARIDFVGTKNDTQTSTLERPVSIVTFNLLPISALQRVFQQQKPELVEYSIAIPMLLVVLVVVLLVIVVVFVVVVHLDQLEVGLVVVAVAVAVAEQLNC